MFLFIGECSYIYWITLRDSLFAEGEEDSLSTIGLCHVRNAQMAAEHPSPNRSNNAGCVCVGGKMMVYFFLFCCCSSRRSTPDK